MDSYYLDLGVNKSGFAHTLPGGRYIYIATQIVGVGVYSSMSICFFTLLTFGS